MRGGGSGGEDRGRDGVAGEERIDIHSRYEIDRIIVIDEDR